MKTFVKRITTTLCMIFILAMICSSPAKAAEQTEIDSWIAACQTMGNNVVKHKFRYSNSNVKSSYKSALKKRKRTNCAAFVSWCMQSYGLIDSGDMFYVKGGGRIHKNFGSWGSKVKVIRVYKKCSKVSLKPGDIVCWTDAHANIYVGKNSDGDKLWIDGGKVATAGNSNGSRYTKAGKKRALSYFNHRKISYIIRIK